MKNFHDLVTKKSKVFVKIIMLMCLVQNPVLADEIQYLWAGANQYRIWIQSEEDIVKQLDAMQNAGLRILRIFLGEAPYQSWETPPDAYTFEPTFGTYDEKNLARVDYLMQMCQDRGLKLIIALNNHSDEYFDTYGAVGMYNSSDAIKYYKKRFSYFLNHENSYLKKKWKDCNDVIYAWEIQNEPGIPLLKVSTYTPEQKHDIMRNFLSQLATFLKSVDPDTKVSLGIAGYANYYHSGGSGDDIKTLGNISDADIYTLHFYGGNIAQWIDDHLSWCRKNGKLLFIEEFGLTRENGMDNIIDRYKYVSENCRIKGVPWMFWRLGLRKDNGTWSIMEDDAVWTQIIKPEVAKINAVQTPDQWDVKVIINSIDMPKSGPAAGGFILHSVYPNPFNSTVRISFSVTERLPLRVEIYDINGRMIRMLTDKLYSRGNYQIAWQTENHSSGIYLCKITAGETVARRKLMLIR